MISKVKMTHLLHLPIEVNPWTHTPLVYLERSVVPPGWGLCDFEVFKGVLKERVWLIGEGGVSQSQMARI